MTNNLRYTSTRAEKRRAARELRKVAVFVRIQNEQSKRFTPANRAQRRAIAKKLGFNWQDLQRQNKALKAA